MANLTTTEAFERKHSGLAARLAGVRGSLQISRDLTICDADETTGCKPHVLPVRHDPAEPMVREPNCGDALVYDAAHPEMSLAALIARIAEKAAPDGPVGADPESLTVFALASRLAATEVPVLVSGPTGSGKEVLARLIHRQSARASAPFVALNCAAIPDTMLEAMLFGHQKGAFTGAMGASTGFFREADGGTLLLDEIAEMPLPLQAKLLRALQEGEVTPVGATRPVKVDVRIVACANRNLPDEVAAGRFREDLYYRLNVFPIHMPPLHYRPADVAPLAAAMLLRHADPRSGPRWISRVAIQLLATHRWPGNVRELENVMRRALVLAHGEAEIGAKHIVFDEPGTLTPPPVPSPAPLAPSAPQSCADKRLGSIVRQSEANAIMDTLRACGGKRIAAARALGISERTLRYRLASYRDVGLAVGAA